MSNENAINILRHINPPRTSKADFDAFRQAIEMATEALKEPQIIRCKDCKWNRTENRKETTQWLPCRALVTPDDFSCIHAEKREVTT